MNNYKIVKNTEWKEVEINGEMVEISKDWEVKKVFDVVEKTKGAIKTGPFGSDIKNNDIQENGIKVYMQDNVLSNNFKKGKNYISLEKFETKLKSCEVFPGDILVTARGTIGKFGLIPKEAEQGILHSSLIRLKMNQNIIKNEYALLSFNKSSYFINYLNKILANTTIPALYSGNISDCNILIPPLTQQSSISSILSVQEKVIEDMEKLISKYQSRFDYLSEELLSGRLRIKEEDGKHIFYKNPDDNWQEVEVNGEMKEIPKDWNVEKLKNNTLIINGFAFPKEKMLNEKVGKSFPIIKIGNIQDGVILENSGTGQNYFNGELKDFFSPLKNDLIIGLSGANAGKTGIFNLNIKTFLNQRNAIVRIIGDKINQSYFNFFWFKDSLNKLKETTKDSAIPNISSDDIQKLDIIIPIFDEQTSIINSLSLQEKLIDEQKKLLEKEKQKFQWLLDNLLSGNYLVEEN